jgi:hypothetical protein
MPSPTSIRARPPCLQQLVADHGGYDRITPEAWAKYDAELSEWHRKRRVELVGEGRVIEAETKRKINR